MEKFKKILGDVSYAIGYCIGYCIGWAVVVTKKLFTL